MAIFPKRCLWRRSLCSNLGGIGLEKLYRATLKCKNGGKYENKAFYVSFFRLSHFQKRNVSLSLLAQIEKCSNDSTKESLLCLVNEAFQLIDSDRVNDNFEQLKLFRLKINLFFLRLQASAVRQTWPFLKNTPKNN